jgi:ribosomal protein S18 acetylase RimI-like enzyme
MNFATIRTARKSDYSDVAEIGTKSYSEEYYKGEESFFSKMEGCPSGCFVADLDGVVGYAISFPYVVGKSFPIDSFFVLVDAPNCWYIHDVCVAEDFRGMGIARMLAKKVIETGWNVVCLTAVQGSEEFWERFGFRSFFELNYCGKKASYMMMLK